MNKITLYGNLTADPETAVSKNGKTFATFSIAVNHGWGENKKVSFFRCVSNDKTAEILCQYTRKGSRILCHGNIEQESWTDKATGQKRSDYKIIVRELELPPRPGNSYVEKHHPHTGDKYDSPFDAPIPADSFLNDNAPF